MAGIMNKIGQTLPCGGNKEEDKYKGGEQHQQQQYNKPGQHQGESRQDQRKEGGGLMGELKDKIHGGGVGTDGGGVGSVDPHGHQGGKYRHDQQHSEYVQDQQPGGYRQDQRKEGGGLMDKVKDKIHGGGVGSADQHQDGYKQDQLHGGYKQDQQLGGYRQDQHKEGGGLIYKVKDKIHGGDGGSADQHQGIYGQDQQLGGYRQDQQLGGYRQDQQHGEYKQDQRKEGGGLMDKVKDKIPGGNGGSAADQHQGVYGQDQQLGGYRQDQQRGEYKQDQRKEGGGLMDKVKDTIHGGAGGGADKHRGEYKQDQYRGD
uniref:Dehydrin 1 n=1 Tax=Vaccinium corymbosum TaxID=69266 RepID=O22623_VACCO|nr:dehydrin 1 [Vaccinium corymbosum]